MSASLKVLKLCCLVVIMLLLSQESICAQSSTASMSSDSVLYKSANLEVRKISEKVYQHISYLSTESFGKVSCNGMIVADGGEAVVFDTPADTASSAELIRYLLEKTHLRITAVVVTHFHADCVAGLSVFHRSGVPSYAYEETLRFLKESDAGAAKPQKTFRKLLKLKAGKVAVFAGFFGEGHTRDNIIAYSPSEKVMFGGCLIKEAGAGKGNLSDANIAAWSETVRKIRQQYPDTRLVIPGHGKVGGPELLDYTIDLFN